MSTLGIEITEQNLDILFFQSLRLFLPLEDKAGLALLGRGLRQGHRRLQRHPRVDDGQSRQRINL
jgi:hypothetical protein